PKLLNFGHKQILKRVVKQNNMKSAEQIKSLFNKRTRLDVSTKTIRKNLHKLEFFLAFRHPNFYLLIGNENWYIKKKYWSIRKWKSVIWRDESHITVFKND